MSLMTVSECAWPKSPPLLEQPASRGSHTLFPVSGLRTAFAVHPRPATYGPLSDTSTSPPRSMAADSMPSTPRKHLSRCAPPALSFRSRAGRGGCDSLSLAGSRQRVKSLRSAVRLHLVFHTARQILSRSVFHSATTTHSLRSCSVSASFPTHLPRARRTARLFLSLLTSLQSQTRNAVSLSGWMCRA